MDAGHSSGLDVVGDVTEDDAVDEGHRQVFRQRDPETCFDLLKFWRKKIIEMVLKTDRQGTFAKGKGLVQLTSSLRQVVLQKRKKQFQYENQLI